MDADTTGPAVGIDVLGPPRLLVGGRPVHVPGTRRRAVLALLALAEGRAVTADHLLDVVWAHERPGSGRAAVHNHISRLRAHLGPAAFRLTTLDGAYRLTLGEHSLDATRARDLRRRARAQADPHDAAALLDQALALWRGPSLAGLWDVPAVEAVALPLERLRWEVTEELVRCRLATGELDGATGRAAEAVSSDPLAEPPVRLLVQALAADGRTVTALRTAREYRHRLATQTGLVATPALDELERAVAGRAPAASPVPWSCPWCGARHAPPAADRGRDR